MKRRAMVRAARMLSHGEQAWVRNAIAVYISRGVDVRRAPNMKVGVGNEITDALTSDAGSKSHTTAAEEVWGAWVRTRVEWLTHEHAIRESRPMFQRRQRERADWADARRACIDLICVLCPEAGEYLLNAEERQRRGEPPQPEPPTTH